MPGFIDLSYHLNYNYQTVYKEENDLRMEWGGAQSETKAAIAGGITTILDMP